MTVQKRLVLEPRDLWWEAKGVFNPAVVELDGRVYLVYRAVGRDNISRFGLAVSEDGEKFEQFDHPVLEGDERNPYERLGIEDPRAVVLGRDVYITYTAASVYPIAFQGSSANSLNSPGVPWRIRTCALQTRDFRRFQHLGVLLPELDTKNSALFPRKIQNEYWLLHRISPSIFVSTSSNLRNWSTGYQLMEPKEEWEKQKVGAACPPIETDRGWLLFYHGVSSQKKYSVGAALLDRDNPAFVIGRTELPLITPTEGWERQGFVNNVVFVTGSICRNKEVWLYYGGGDKVVGLAKIPLDAVFESLHVAPKPR